MCQRWPRPKTQIIIHRHLTSLVTGFHPGDRQTFPPDQLLLILNITPVNSFYLYNIIVGHWRSLIFYLKEWLQELFFKSFYYRKIFKCPKREKSIPIPHLMRLIHS